jgi:DNA mismatch repair protein MutH
MLRLPPPQNLDQLLGRARGLEGRSLSEIAQVLRWPVPLESRRAKGWAGQLIEAALGAPGGGQPAPDFEALGVELKTLPLDRSGRPRESTWVCTAPLDGRLEGSWAESRVRHKLAQVLWIPLLTAQQPGEALVGPCLYWRPSAEEEALLRADWEELAEVVARGELWLLKASLGRVLQLRPKAADAEERVPFLDEEGQERSTVPRGFYLRAGFTAELLRGVGLGGPRRRSSGSSPASAAGSREESAPEGPEVQPQSLPPV